VVSVSVLAVTGVASSPQVALRSSISMAPLCSMIRSTAGTCASSSSDTVTMVDPRRAASG